MPRPQTVCANCLVSTGCRDRAWLNLVGAAFIRGEGNLGRRSHVESKVVKIDVRDDVEATVEPDRRRTGRRGRGRGRGHVTAPVQAPEHCQRVQLDAAVGADIQVALGRHLLAEGTSSIRPMVAST